MTDEDLFQQESRLFGTPVWRYIFWQGFWAGASLATIPWLIGFAIMMALGCATTAPPPLPRLPPPADLGTVLPPAPAPSPIPSTVRRYEDRNVRAGQCPGLPPGILVSPAVYAEQVLVLAERRRLRIEVAALLRLRVEERAAAEAIEGAYQARLAQIAARQRAFPWAAMAVFGAGVLIGGLAAVASRPTVVPR